MEYFLVLALALFLLTSASNRTTSIAPRATEVSPPARVQNVQPVNSSNKSWAYEQVDAGKLRAFIRKFQPKYQEYQVDTMANTIIKNGKIYDLDPKLVAALIARESGFDPKATSSTGAMGLGQIKSFHFTRLGITNPYDVEQGTKGVSIMLRELLNKWAQDPKPMDMALAEYREGMTALKDGAYKPETQKYIDEIHKLRSELM
jgi:soluble lytic murein transglycosylase-like protein